jgi:DNA-binding MarR family transcriptional regulator
VSSFRLESRLDSLLREVRELRTALDGALERLNAVRFDRDARDKVTNLEIAEGILQTRRLREDLFGAEMFADPAWDMLLHLFVNAERGRSVPVSCLCVASAVPQSTALRWIDTMTNAKLVTRRPDPQDARRQLIALTAEAMRLMRVQLRRTRASFLMLGDTSDSGNGGGRGA